MDKLGFHEITPEIEQILNDLSEQAKFLINEFGREPDCDDYIDEDEGVGYIIGDIKRNILPKRNSSEFIKLIFDQLIILSNPDSLNKYRNKTVSILNSLSDSKSYVHQEIINYIKKIINKQNSSEVAEALRSLIDLSSHCMDLLDIDQHKAESLDNAEGGGFREKFNSQRSTAPRIFEG